MKILKMPDQLVFNTSPKLKNRIHYHKKIKKSWGLIPLDVEMGKPTWDVLLEHFRGEEYEEHPIFWNYNRSRYYAIKS